MEKQDTQVRDHNRFAIRKLNFGKFYIAMLRVALCSDQGWYRKTTEFGITINYPNQLNILSTNRTHFFGPPYSRKSKLTVHIGIWTHVCSIEHLAQRWTISRLARHDILETSQNETHHCWTKLRDSRSLQLAKHTFFDEEPDVQVKDGQMQHQDASN